MSELNMSLEYLPITKELKDISNLKNEDVWIEQNDQDDFGNPRFKINSNTSCTVQTSMSGDWYIAFVRVSELIDNSYINNYFKAFASRDKYDESNNPIYFDRFQEWVKVQSTGKWIQKSKL